MKKLQAILLSLALLLLLLAGCEKYSDHDKYKRPDWLPGKLYTAVLLQQDLGLFAECLRLTGFDTIIDVSGSWTVFAPTDEAMRQYLQDHHYARVADIPYPELDRLTRFHIIQNQWSLLQLKSLGMNGWRTVNTTNVNFYAYKFETILRNPDEKYWIKKAKKKEMIVRDSTQADQYKRAYTSSRKYVPVFYDQYLAVNGLTPEDYQFYFNRAFEPGSVYYGPGKIVRWDIFAENGFVHVVDRVVEPMLNAQEQLEQPRPGESYQLFLDMVYWYYPHFELNMVATNRQPGVKSGAVVDTLWDLNYAALPFNPQKEQFDIVNQTLVRHNGLVAPVDAPFQKFIDEILTTKSGFPHWNDYKSLPLDVVDIIVGQNFKSSPVYPNRSQYKKIFKGSSRFHQNEEDIIRKDFGSNSTFIGLRSYTPDRVFTSVTAPVFCRPIFSVFRQAMVYSGTYDAIATHKGPLYFFPITDYSLMADSSLPVNWIDRDRNLYSFTAYNRNMHRWESISSRTLSNWILNQVGTSVSGAGTSKETIKTLGGNTLTWDHTTNTIQGPYPSTFGYKGSVIVTNSPFPLTEPMDNGKSFTVKNWFNFSN